MSNLPRDWRLLQIMFILQNSVFVRSLSFKCILYVLEQPILEEKINGSFRWHYNIISIWSLVQLLVNFHRHVFSRKYSFSFCFRLLASFSSKCCNISPDAFETQMAVKDFESETRVAWKYSCSSE